MGENIELTPIYLSQALEILVEFAILLPFVLWRKVAKDKEQQAFENLNEASYKLISNERYVSAERILEFSLGLDKVVLSQETRQMMIVNRASALRHMKKEQKAVEVLDSIDWSASSDLFKICVAAVRGDAEKVADLLPSVKGSGSIDARVFKEWPCLAFVREDAAVRKAFEKAFGEPLSVPSKRNAVESPAQPEENAEDQGDSETVH